MTIQFMAFHVIIQCKRYAIMSCHHCLYVHPEVMQSIGFSAPKKKSHLISHFRTITRQSPGPIKFNMTLKLRICYANKSAQIQKPLTVNALICFILSDFGKKNGSKMRKRAIPTFSFNASKYAFHLFKRYEKIIFLLLVDRFFD